MRPGSGGRIEFIGPGNPPGRRFRWRLALARRRAVNHVRYCDIELLGTRIVAATDWLQGRVDLQVLPVGCFGASTGAAAALIAAAERPAIMRAVVSRGGRPDLAGSALPKVKAPTLLIVGGHDEPVIDLNEQAKVQMQSANVS